MIRPTADTLPGRCLSAIAAAPGDHTAESLATRLLPWAPPPTPAPDPRWARLGLAPVWSTRHAAARADHLAAATNQIARALSRLTEAGYLAPAGSTVALHPTAQAHLSARGLPSLLTLAAPETDDEEAPDPEASASAEAILRALAAGPTTYRALLGSRPSGAAKAAYRALAEALLIATPSHRHPTPAGAALAASWKKERPGI